MYSSFYLCFDFLTQWYMYKSIQFTCISKNLHAETSTNKTGYSNCNKRKATELPNDATMQTLPNFPHGMPNTRVWAYPGREHCLGMCGGQELVVMATRSLKGRVWFRNGLTQRSAGNDIKRECSSFSVILYQWGYWCATLTGYSRLFTTL